MVLTGPEGSCAQKVAVGVSWAAGLTPLTLPLEQISREEGAAQRAEHTSVISASLAPGPDLP